MTEKRAYLNKIRKEFPSLQWKKARLITHGWDHDVVMLDDRYVFRFPKSKHNKKMFAWELKFLHYLQPRLTLPVPKYKFVAQGYRFGGYSGIKGDELTAGIFRKVNTRTRGRIAKSLAKFITKLHSTDLRVARKFRTETVDFAIEHKDLLRALKREVFAKVPKRFVATINDFLAEFGKMRFPSKCLVHNDLTWEHILIGKDLKKIAGVIDFGDLRIADPAVDFAGLWDYGSRFIEQVYQSYRGPKDDRFLERSKMYYKRIGVYLLLDLYTEKHVSKQKAFRDFRKRFDLK